MHSVEHVLRRPPVTLKIHHNHELATAHIAHKVKLDLNDVHLLLEEINHAGGSAPITLDSLPKIKSGTKSAERSASQRYNISNDDAYDLLRENHQRKIRGMLGNLHVAHSSPALRLQWPFVSLPTISMSTQINVNSTKLDWGSKRLGHFTGHH